MVTMVPSAAPVAGSHSNPTVMSGSPAEAGACQSSGTLTEPQYPGSCEPQWDKATEPTVTAAAAVDGVAAAEPAGAANVIASPAAATVAASIRIRPRDGRRADRGRGSRSSAQGWARFIGFPFSIALREAEFASTQVLTDGRWRAGS